MVQTIQERYQKKLLRQKAAYPHKRQQLIETSLKYYYDNRKKILERMRLKRIENLENAREKERQYRKTPKQKITRKAGKQRGRARKRNAPLNDLTHQQWLEVQEAQNHRCYYCKKRCKGRLTQDHLTPLSQGGSHTLHNVIAVCASCNSCKGTRPPPIPVQPLLLTVAPAKKQKAS